MAEHEDPNDRRGEAERRLARRRDISLQAEADLGGDQAPLGCWLRDISDSGARLEISGAANIPAHFTLNVGDEIYTCEKVWQGPLFVGVHFEANEYVRALLERIYQLFDEADGNVGAIISLATAARNGAFGTLNLPGLGGALDRVAADGRALITSMDELAREFGKDRLELLPDRDAAGKDEPTD